MGEKQKQELRGRVRTGDGTGDEREKLVKQSCQIWSEQEAKLDTMTVNPFTVK